MTKDYGVEPNLELTGKTSILSRNSESTHRKLLTLAPILRHRFRFPGSSN